MTTRGQQKTYRVKERVPSLDTKGFGAGSGTQAFVVEDQDDGDHYIVHLPGVGSYNIGEQVQMLDVKEHWMVTLRPRISWTVK